MTLSATRRTSRKRVGGSASADWKGEPSWAALILPLRLR